MPSGYERGGITGGDLEWVGRGVLRWYGSNDDDDDDVIYRSIDR